MKRNYRHLDTITALFVTTLFASDLLSSAKLVDMHINLFGLLPMSFDGGLIIFPICYIFGDILTEVYGYKRSRKVIWLGFLSLMLVSLAVKILQILPAEQSWAAGGGPAAYDYILNGFASGGLITGSILAYLVGEFTNSFTLAKMKILQAGHLMGVRFVASTAVGELFDTLIFFVITCAFGVFPWELFWSLAVTNYIFKVAIEVVLLPVTYRVTNWLKSSEQEDYYDCDTNFNPFALNT